MLPFRRLTLGITSTRAACRRRLAGAALGCALAWQPAGVWAQVGDEPPDPLQEFELYEGLDRIDDHAFLRKVAPVAPALSARRGVYLGTELADGAVPVGQVLLILGLGLTAGSYVVGSLGRSSVFGPDIAADVVAAGNVLQTSGWLTALGGGALWLGASGLKAVLAPRNRPFYVLEAERAAAKYNILYPWATALRVRRLEAIRPTAPEPMAPPGPRPAEISAEPTAYLGTETARVLADNVWLASVSTTASAYPLHLSRGFGGFGEADLGLGFAVGTAGRSLGSVGGAWKHVLLNTGGSQLALRTGLGVAGLGEAGPPTVGTQLALPLSFSLGPVVLTTTPLARLGDLAAAGLGLQVGGSLGVMGRLGGGWSVMADVTPRTGLAGGFDAPASLGLRFSPSSQACLDLTLGQLGFAPEIRATGGTVGLAGHIRL